MPGALGQAAEIGVSKKVPHLGRQTQARDELSRCLRAHPHRASAPQALVRVRHARRARDRGSAHACWTASPSTAQFASRVGRHARRVDLDAPSRPRTRLSGQHRVTGMTPTLRCASSNPGQVALMRLVTSVDASESSSAFDTSRFAPRSRSESG